MSSSLGRGETRCDGGGDGVGRASAESIEPERSLSISWIIAVTISGVAPIRGPSVSRSSRESSAPSVTEPDPFEPPPTEPFARALSPSRTRSDGRSRRACSHSSSASSARSASACEGEDGDRRGGARSGGGSVGRLKREQGNV